MELNLQSLEKLDTPDLETLINELIKNDFSRLVQLLYRIDVSEKKLKNILQENPNENAGKLIAAVIIERLEATKKARENFKTSPGIDDKEERL
jgi:hypothetical protein